jgi:methylenetetrahydrofolate reductase (NADPH)
MIRRIRDILNEKELTYSFEFFPPKTKKGNDNLFETARMLKELEPDWFAVTYGAGGSTRESTMDLVDELQKRFEIPTMHHLTCISHSKAELRTIIEKMKERGICNVLALRGDPPQDAGHWEPAPGGLEYAYQLCKLIRSYDTFFSIGVAGFPEGHIDCPDKETDSKYLKIKIDAGGEFVITQLFFDNKNYFEYLERTKKIGITVRIIPGILPITNYQTLVRFCKTCGATIPHRVHDIFKPLDGDDEATYNAGVQFAVEQCNQLLEDGAPGLHFFTLNKVDPTREILNKIKQRRER